MRLHPLGHAMLLVEAAGLRLLFDPLLEDRHHGGVFDVVPPRTVHAETLQPDFIFVSHRHPDHFDVPSLARLATLDADSVVITPDGLVARTAERLGFRTVRVVPPETRVELDGVTFVTTPSLANDQPIAPEAIEWGVALASDGVSLWNQVDTVHRNLSSTLDQLEAALAAKLSLALVVWCPLLEIQASLAGSIGFPFAAYAELIEQAAVVAERSRVVVPGSAGARHAPPWSAMNALVYPVDEARFLRDLAARAPNARTLPSSAGRVLDVRTGHDDGASPHATLHPFVDDRVFRPHDIPRLVDPNLEQRDEGAMRTTLDAWVRDSLAPTCTGTERCVLEVVYPSSTDAWTLRGGEVTRESHPDWDLRNVVAASWLCDVIEGRRHFGDLLLAGVLRAATRAYSVTARRLHASSAPIFLYRPISYAASFERAIEHQIRLYRSR